MRLSLLEDDPFQRDTLGRWLREAGHDVHVFASGRDFMRSAGRESYDLCLLDWMAPELSGRELLQWLREDRRDGVPVIFVTALNDEDDIVDGLSAGADDYIVKPVRRRELLCRIEAVLRRARPAAMEQTLEIGAYRFELQLKRAFVRGAAVTLTDKEFELAVFLFRNLGRLLSRSHLLEAVWSRSASLPTRTVDTHVSRVRSKLGLRPEHGFRLISAYNCGYRLEHICTAAPAVREASHNAVARV